MKRSLSIMLLFLIGLILGITLLEIFLRVNPKFGYIYNSFKVLSSKEDATLLSPSLSVQPSLLLGYENIPNSNWTNSFGLVGKSYDLKKDNNTFRILLLGDSIAHQDLSRQYLEKKLNSNSGLNSKYKFEIWNAGVPSYDVRRYALYLQHKGLRYKPDMVIIFICMNDFVVNENLYYKTKNGLISYYFSLPKLSKIYSVNPLLMKYSYLYRFIMLRIDNYLSSNKENPNIDLREENGKYYLSKIAEICREKEIPLLAVIFPYFKPLNEYSVYQKGEYRIINDVIKDLKLKYINLYNYLPEKELYDLRYYRQDEIHPSPEGNALIADIIYNYLIKSSSFFD